MITAPPSTSRALVTAVLTAALVLAATPPAPADDGNRPLSPMLSSDTPSPDNGIHGKAPGKPGKAGRGTLVSLPPVVQAGSTPASPRNRGQVVATFVPSRPGASVVLEQFRARGWKVVKRDRQDSWGSAAFEVRPGRYRASTQLSRQRTVTTGPLRAGTWTPSFEDTFSGTTLDASVWNDQKREHESVYAPRTCARADPATRRVSDGVLHLGIALDPTRLDQRCSFTSPRATGEQSYLLNSQVATEYTRSFNHGFMSARIKPQRAKGMHSSFWLLPEGTQFTDGDPTRGAEIDVMEFFGETSDQNQTIGSFVGYYEPGWRNVQFGDLFPKARRALRSRAEWWEEFHVFSLEWSAEEYVFRVDGREYYRETKAVSHVPQYLVLSMLTSDHELNELTPDELGDTAQVDWVQVYDRLSTTSRPVKG